MVSRRKAANILGLPLSIDVIMFHNDEIENILTYVAALNNVTNHGQQITY
jgi:hypothetical protein